MATGPKVEKPAAATPGVFDLTAEHEAALTVTRGRPQKPSEYLDVMREALSTKSHKGIKFTGKDDAEKQKNARRIGVELRKGAQQLSKESGKNIKVSTQNTFDHPKLGSFVAFTVSEVTPAPAQA